MVLSQFSKTSCYGVKQASDYVYLLTQHISDQDGGGNSSQNPSKSIAGAFIVAVGC